MKLNRLFLIGLLVLTGPALASSLQFSDYPVKRVYQGKMAVPQFIGRDKRWKNFRTIIRDEMLEGPDYAGEISVIQIGCGTGCTFVVLGNVRTGKLHDFPRQARNSLHLQVLTRPTSRLLIAQWEEADGCHLAHYLWTGKDVKELGREPVLPVEQCLKDIEENRPPPRSTDGAPSSKRPD